MAKKINLINRELSWLSFNARVLQQAEDISVPLVERLRFLGIFSNNRDEFFRVRVGTIKRLIRHKHKSMPYQDIDPTLLLSKVQKVIVEQEKKFHFIYRQLIKDAVKNDIHIIDETQLDEKQKQFVTEYFESKVQTSLVPIMLYEKRNFPELRDKAIYLAVKLSKKMNPKETRYALIEVPTAVLPRFYVLPKQASGHYIILLDDIIRANFNQIFSIFNYDIIDAHIIKLTRDAELEVAEDISKSFIDKISKSIKGRAAGQPVRFIYDNKIPEDLLSFIIKKLKLKRDENLIPGGRYHNFKDFINFPDLGPKKLIFNTIKPLNHPLIQNNKPLFDQIKSQDILLNYPYQSFNYIIDLMREAAIDPNVKSISINLYRVAKNSKVLYSLINAAKNGKKIEVIIELQARFDEENNIYWSNKLQEQGVKVIFGVPGLKVHSKMILIKRKEKTKIVSFAYVGTGNFNESTATLYTDTGLLTSDTRITNEVVKTFDFLKNNYQVKRYKHLIVSPFGTRRKFLELINHEIKNAKKEIPSFIILKMNNLVDKELINKLYEASQHGVKIKLIIRGICALIPGEKNISDNITAISIVGRFLEHSRIIIFANGGDEKVFISSADWMMRNLDKRIEVTVPIYDSQLKSILKTMLLIQLSDNCNARILDKNQENKYVQTKGIKIRSQIETYKFFESQLK